MGFSKEFVDNASKKVESKTALADYIIIEPILKKAVERAAETAPYFDPKDVQIYLQGSYASETNISFQSKLEIVVEITRTKEFSADSMKKSEFILLDNFYIEFNHYFDVKRFKDILVAETEKIIKRNIEMKPVNFTIPMHGDLRHDIDVCPCFSYKYFDAGGGSIRGKLVYNSEINENYLIFTNLHAENGDMKDEATGGVFKKIVRLFKTLMAISRREDGDMKFVRGYYIECLLYNVPNEMYYSLDGKTLSVFLKIINWLNFADMSNFVCQNQIWSLWGGADGFWDKASAKRFVNDVIEFYNGFPNKRDEIIKE
jgi:hypothetical protein